MGRSVEALKQKYALLYLEEKISSVKAAIEAGEVEDEVEARLTLINLKADYEAIKDVLQKVG